MARRLHASHKLIMDDARCLRDRGFSVAVSRSARSVVVGSITLPGRGWTRPSGKPIKTTQLWVPLPPNFPSQPPGVGHAEPGHAFHCPDLHVRGKRIRDLYSCSHTSGTGGWHWFCFQRIAWDAKVPRPLVALVELFEISLADRARRTR